MAESVAQGMHHMAHQSTLSETDEDLFYDAQLDAKPHCVPCRNDG